MYRITYKRIGIILKGEIVKLTKLEKADGVCQVGKSRYSITQWNNDFIQGYTCECYLDRYTTLANTLWTCKTAMSKFKIIEVKSNEVAKAICYYRDIRQQTNVGLSVLFNKWNYSELNT